MSVITRFAPSPTGMLHLGGARTALFNWLYARHYKGKFLLRMEDTDKARSTAEAAQDIYETLRWLGLMWDEEPVIQSRRQGRHQQVAYQLLEEGKAYACYCTPEELALMREQAIQEGRPPLYDRRWRDRSNPPPSDIRPAIRLKVPLEGRTVLHDQVQGKVAVDHATLDDMVLLRSDGTPTYMLAVVVDDHDMGITHIIRGDDHLTNAFRQIQIYNALEWEIPTMGHIPLIHGADGQKLSKRLGALPTSDYRTQGVLPEALLNALVRLGWSHGNDEKISVEQAVAWFDGTGLSKSAARFDEEKVWALNAYYLRQKSAEDLWALVQSYEDGRMISQGDKEKALAILPALAQRCKSLKELQHSLLPYIFPDILPIALLPEEKKIVEMFDHEWQGPQEWTPSSLEFSMRQWVQHHHLSFGQLAKPLRLALTGSPVSPSLTEVMVALGPLWTRDRIRRSYTSCS